MNKTLGIIGGMGPLATAYLFNKIISLTYAKTDQEHINIIIYNNTLIPDRTSYIIANGENPTNALIESAKKLEGIGSDYIIMPCNTAHHFYDDISNSINIPLLNMIEETAKYISNNYPNEKKIGLFATEGTYKTGLYNTALRKYGVSIIVPSDDKKQYIIDLIDDVKSGNSNINLKNYYLALNEMHERGINRIILGCTELSVVYDMFNMRGQYINPAKIIAVSAINMVGKKVRNINQKI
jgi:aspartate racemase